MPIRNLWAPWRARFVGGERQPRCIFCAKPREGDDETNLILGRWSKCFAMLNLFPYNNAHTMVAPYRHVRDPRELEGSEAEELLRSVCTVMEAIAKSYKPHGFNLGANVGQVSGAGFDHFHIHVVPRWEGDTNFMPVLGETKVISEEIGKTYDLLRRAMCSQ